MWIGIVSLYSFFATIDMCVWNEPLTCGENNLVWNEWIRETSDAWHNKETWIRLEENGKKKKKREEVLDGTPVGKYYLDEHVKLRKSLFPPWVFFLGSVSMIVGKDWTKYIS